MEQDALSAVVDWIKDSNKIVFLTGSELSLEAGIPDVTDSSFNPDIRQFKNIPEVREKYWSKIKDHYPRISSALPTAAHEAIYEIELLFNVDCILTQSADGLHAKAGSEKVIEIYSSINWVTCPDCGKDRKMEDVMLDIEDNKMPRCLVCNSDQIKPPLSFPGQALPHWEIRESWMRLKGCDLFIIVGANLENEPVASFPFQVMNEGNKVVIISEGQTPADDFVSAVINGKPSQVLPYIVKQLKEKTIVS
ncbi:MAG: hypothetical protein GTO02_08185 [Candidatus Dadabacteria bacterium]|nr:hypothetical protein [Candidatus Dadabacteria bacterium]NIQ14368.1 hypothetical protein [Candidatus Dadabacteria bacterium]